MSSFLEEFANNALDAMNMIDINNFFHEKSVQKGIPDYSKNKATLVVSFTYTKSIASKILIHKLKGLSKRPLTPKMLNPKLRIVHVHRQNTNIVPTGKTTSG